MNDWATVKGVHLPRSIYGGPWNAMLDRIGAIMGLDMQRDANGRLVHPTNGVTTLEFIAGYMLDVPEDDILAYKKRNGLP